MTKGQSIKVKYAMEKTTPGTVRYMEVDDAGNKRSANDGAVSPTLYIRKTALGDTVPQRLEVTINAV